jgi:DNA repair protein RecO (recombination protein O)
MPEAVKTTAIVLGHIRYGESDLIVTFLTETHGLVKAIAKGALRSRRRFPGGFEPFTTLELGLKVSGHGGLARVESADVVAAHYGIREDLDRITAGACMLEIVSLVESAGAESGEAFHLLGEGLRLLEVSDNPRSLSAVFIIKYLDLSGFGPPISSCSRCGRPLRDVGAFYAGGTGLTCPACGSFYAGSGSVRLSPGALAFIGTASATESTKMGRLRLTGASGDEVSGFLKGYAAAVLGRRMKSLDALGKLGLT